MLSSVLPVNTSTIEYQNLYLNPFGRLRLYTGQVERKHTVLSCTTQNNVLCATLNLQLWNFWGWASLPFWFHHFFAYANYGYVCETL